MKLISWNCQGAFRKKAEIVLKYNPDILVIQECEQPEKINFNSCLQQPKDILWFGNSKDKGLGVFSFGDYKLKLFSQYNSDFRLIVPISIQGGKFDYTLFPVWASNSKDARNGYIEQVWKAINYYDTDFFSDRTIITGDFNSNRIWDSLHHRGNHSDVVDKLAKKNIFSIYHKYFKEDQGKESVPTFYSQRNKNKPYHIDYCFVSQDLFGIIKNFEIGFNEEWKTFSDHSPLIVEFNF